MPKSTAQFELAALYETKQQPAEAAKVYEQIQKDEQAANAPDKKAPAGAQTPALGGITFPIIKRDVDDILTASDAELVACMRFAFTRMKLVIEPTGCLAFAAARRMRDQLKGQRVGVLVSGGNVDLDRFCELME